MSKDDIRPQVVLSADVPDNEATRARVKARLDADRAFFMETLHCYGRPATSILAELSNLMNIFSYIHHNAEGGLPEVLCDQHAMAVSSIVSTVAHFLEVPFEDAKRILITFAHNRAFNAHQTVH